MGHRNILRLAMTRLTATTDRVKEVAEDSGTVMPFELKMAQKQGEINPDYTYEAS